MTTCATASVIPQALAISATPYPPAAKNRPWPNETLPVRASTTMPSAISALEAAIVASDSVHVGSTRPNSVTLATSATMTRGCKSFFTKSPSSSNPPCRLALEQALGANQQDRRHDQIDHEQFGLRHQMHRSGARQSHQDRTDRRALDAAQSPDHDDGEAQDDDVRAQPRLHRYFRRGQRAGKRSEQHAESEGDRIDAIDAHAHAHAHFLVMDDGEHDLADHGAIETEPDRKAHRGRD